MSTDCGASYKGFRRTYGGGVIVSDRRNGATRPELFWHSGVDASTPQAVGHGGGLMATALGRADLLGPAVRGLRQFLFGDPKKKGRQLWRYKLSVRQLLKNFIGLSLLKSKNGMYKSYCEFWPKHPFPPLESTAGIVRHMTDIVITILVTNDETHQKLATSIAEGRFPMVISAAANPVVQELLDPLPEKFVLDLWALALFLVLEYAGRACRYENMELENSRAPWNEFVADLEKQKRDEKLFSALVIIERAGRDAFLHAPINYMEVKERDAQLRGWKAAPAASVLGAPGLSGQLPVQPIPALLRKQVDKQKAAQAKLDAALRQLAGDDTLSLKIYRRAVERLTGEGEVHARGLEELLG